MGNNQSNVREGLQFCSGNTDPLARRFMVDKDFRVDFSSKRNIEKELMTSPKSQMSKRYSNEVTKYYQKRETCTSQQPVRDENWQQQKQEEFCDFILPVKLHKDTPKIQVETQKKNFVENTERTAFKGIFGDVVLNKNHVSYKDCSGEEFDETFNPKSLKKTFPMGISYGGLTKSLWFKDTTDRDACFDIMTGNLPPSYAAVKNNPSIYRIPNGQSVSVDEKDKLKVFDGICGNDVIVRKNGPVSYTDIDGEKHCVSYNRNTIQKCFPKGICFGGLDRTIWLKDEIERDLCYLFMRMVGDTAENKEPDEEKTFPALCGTVVVRSGYEVEYTSLGGDRVTAVWYDPRAIRTVFPLGVTGGGLPSTIWFKDMEDLDNCITAMKKDVF